MKADLESNADGKTLEVVRLCGSLRSLKILSDQKQRLYCTPLAYLDHISASLTNFDICRLESHVRQQAEGALEKYLCFGNVVSLAFVVGSQHCGKCHDGVQQTEPGSSNATVSA